jgi:oligopeptide transport system substrate-binding protein
MPIARLLGFIALTAAPLLALSACDNHPEGEVSVSVIGAAPRLLDPASGSMTAPDAVLLQSVAQGLVAFDTNGDIIGGLAERWNVSDDGLSYIFRIQSAKWPDGSKITAEQVARSLKRQVQSKSRNPLKDTLGAIDEIVAMTDRVIEIRLVAPRPNLLPLLAQPEMSIVRNGAGSGPFTLDRKKAADGSLRLERSEEQGDDEVTIKEAILLNGQPSEKAIAAFDAGKTDMVLGGTFADLPLARRVSSARKSLRFDQAGGLFGLVPLAATGPLKDPDVRSLLSELIDRDALVAALGVPGLQGRVTLLEPGLDGMTAPVVPAWASTKPADRQVQLSASVNRLFGKLDKPAVRLFIPDGPGGDILFQRLQHDWSVAGLDVQRVRSARSADFMLIDEVAPSNSAAWYARRFRCDAVPVCAPEADDLMKAAREASIPAQRYALIGQAAALVERNSLFIPLAAPIRWSLVGPRIVNFAGNRYARHTLVDLTGVPTAKE